MLKASSVFFACLSLFTLGLVVFLARTIDLLIATTCSVAGVLYIFFLARKVPEQNIELGQRKHRSSLPSLLLIVAVAPFAISTVLAYLGMLGDDPLQAALRTVIIVGFSITFFFISFSIPLAIEHKLKEDRTTHEDQRYRPLVSILVPAYNEERVISRSLESLVNVKYEPKEIIVIDDGSTDKTNAVASWYKQFGIKIVKKPNGGKASALNYGLVFARGEIIVTVDADSMVSRNAIDEVVKIMSNRQVVAVSGNIKVLNNRTKLARVQELEYVISINMLRRALDLFGAVMIVPGAFGAFKRYAIENTGYYDKDILTEDFDLTVKMLKAYGAVGASSTASAYTEVPTTWKSLYKQRIRWTCGMLQTAIKHKDTLWNSRYAYLHSIVIPILFLSYLMPFASFGAITAGVLLVVSGQPLIFAYMLGLFFLIELFVVLMTISLSESSYSLALYAPAFVIGYKQFLDAVSIIGVFAVSFRKDRRWNRTDRVGGLPSLQARDKSRGQVRRRQP